MNIKINKADMTKHDGTNRLPLAGHEDIIVLHKNGLVSCGWLDEYVRTDDIINIDYYITVEFEVVP